MTWLDIKVSDWPIIQECINEGDMDGIICHLHDISQEKLDDMDYEEGCELRDSFAFILQPIPRLNKKELGELHLMDFNSIEFGAFMDLEYFLTKDQNWMDNIFSILPILWRKKTKTDDGWYGDEFEKYNNFSKSRKNYFSDFLWVDVYGGLMDYLDYRDRLYKNYEGMFDVVEQITEEEVVRMTAEERKEVELQRRIQKWGFELLLLKLSQNDPLRMGDAMELPLARAFNILAMMHELKINHE